MVKLATAVGVLLSATSLYAYSVPDHRLITQLAIQELKECQMLPAMINNDSATAVILKADLDEDNYLKNGFKKLFEYSHFYNPFRPLQKELIRAHHADAAVTEYTKNILDGFSSDQRKQLAQGNQQLIGQIIHLTQDASSAPHVLWINHGMADGFENKVSISEFELRQLKPNCSEISLAGLNSPLDIMKAAGLASMKELYTSSVEYTEIMADGSEPRVNIAPWSQTFFTNDGVNTNQVLNFLRNYNYLNPNLNTPTRDDQNRENWNTQSLGRGEYGYLSSDITNVLIRGDNFGNTQTISVGNKKYHVDLSQYVSLKKTLMRQAILSTQRALLWLNTL
ncbi:MAG: hypothetical protein ACXWQQ_03325 [Pseudobdellovibrio sp.]